MSDSESISIDPIGIFHSCYAEKFGVPRQPGLVPEAAGVIELFEPYDDPSALSGLEQYSHLWVLFRFDAKREAKWSPTVRPPRLGGNQRMGVFATRSPNRPNQIGMSAVKIDRIRPDKGKIEVSGHDIVHGTKILDLKPYLPYADSLADAKCELGDAPESKLKNLPVVYEIDVDAEIRPVLEATLKQDPRPAYQQGLTGKSYGIRICDYNIRWEVTTETIRILSFERLD